LEAVAATPALPRERGWICNRRRDLTLIIGSAIPVLERQSIVPYYLSFLAAILTLMVRAVTPLTADQSYSSWC
jgi:hypothetical protein